MKNILLALLFTPSLFAQLPPGNEKGVSMGHIHFLVSDPEIHKKLWVDALGAEIVNAGPLELYQFPGVQLALATRASSGGNQGTVLDHLGFKVKDLDATKAKLTEGGATVMSENPETRQMFVLFPDEIKIEFTEDTSLAGATEHHHIHFASPQIDEQRAWYEKTFGAKLGMSGRFQAAAIPGVDLRWNSSEEALPGIRGCSVDHIGFEIENLEEFCKRLEEEGIEFNVPFRAVPQLGLNIAFITDPWGVYIELTEGLAVLE